MRPQDKLERVLNASYITLVQALNLRIDRNNIVIFDCLFLLLVVSHYLFN